MTKKAPTKVCVDNKTFFFHLHTNYNTTSEEVISEEFMQFGITTGQC